MRSTNCSKARKMPARSPWFSRWSASTLVMIAADGRVSRNEPSLSSASTMASSPVPRCAFLPRLVEVSADREGRVDAAGLRAHGQQRGGRGLAVRSGDGDAAAVLERGGQGGGPAQHRHAAGPRGGELLVLRGDRGRVDEGVDVGQVLDRVPDVHVGADRAQGGDGERVTCLAAGDLDAAGEQDAGQGAHAGAGDTHDVHRPRSARAGTTSVAALRTSAAPGALQSCGRPSAASWVGRSVTAAS